MCFFFFFQAEDGIRDWSVTGVQTCALPISFIWASADVVVWIGGGPLSSEAGSAWRARAEASKEALSRCCRGSLSGFCRFSDHIEHELRLRQLGDVASLRLDVGGAHVLGVEELQDGVDC